MNKHGRDRDDRDNEGRRRKTEMKERNEKIRKRLLEGVPSEFIGENFGLTTSAVQQIAQGMGIKPGRSSDWFGMDPA